MSVIATVYIPEGIIMAADSRVTGYIQYENNLTDRYSLSDNGQKVFLLSKRKVGISSCGEAEICGQTIADFIREFEILHVKEDDSIKEIADNLRLYIHQKKKDANVKFHVAGYDGDEQKIYVTNGESTHINNDERKYGAIWDGDKDHLTSLINGYPQMIFDWNHMYLKDGIELAEFMIDVNCKAQKFSMGVATCGGPIDILLLTKDETRWIKHKILNP